MTFTELSQTQMCGKSCQAESFSPSGARSKKPQTKGLIQESTSCLNFKILNQKNLENNTPLKRLSNNIKFLLGLLTTTSSTLRG